MDIKDRSWLLKISLLASVLILAASVALFIQVTSERNALREELRELENAAILEKIDRTRETMQVSLESLNLTMVASGFEMVDTVPESTSQTAAYYSKDKLEGTWRGINWTLEIDQGDYILINEDIERNALTAQIYRYNKEPELYYKVDAILASE